MKFVPAPPETKCGNLNEAPFWALVNQAGVEYECEQVKTKDGVEDRCRFKCTGKSAGGTTLIPSVGYPIGVTVCIQPFELNKKGKPSEALLPAMWVDNAFAAPVECVDPTTHTVCGDIKTGDKKVDMAAGVTVECVLNVCTFGCENEDEIPSLEFTSCGMLANQTDFQFNPTPKEAVKCAPKPDDTACGNVREHYTMSPDTEFTLGVEGTFVMFECAGGKLASPATAQCSGGVFSHPAGQEIRCY